MADELLPGAAPPTEGNLQYDPTKDLYYISRGGSKQYVSPFAFSANGPSGKGTGFGKLTPQSSGLVHGRGEWNAETGQFDQGLNWGNIGSIAVGAGIAGPAIAGALGGASGAGAGGGAALSSGSTVPTLGALAGGTASGAVPAAFAGGGALAAGAAAPMVGSVAGGVSSGAVPVGMTAGGGATLASTAGKFMASQLGQQAISTAGNLFGSLFATNANSNAADKQEAAAKYAADLQAKAANEALSFQKQQAALDAQNAEITRRANYEQYGARQSDLNTFGNLLGLPNRNMPAYTPLQTYQSSGTLSGMAGGQNMAPGASGDQQSAFMAMFPGDTLSSDMLVAKEGDLGKMGIKVLRNAEGRAGKIQLATGQIVDVVQGGGTGLNRKQWLTGGGPTAPTVARSQPTLSSLTAPWAGDPLTPALQAPNPLSLYGMVR